MIAKKGNSYCRAERNKRNLRTQKAVAHAQRAPQLFGSGFYFAELLNAAIKD